MAGQGQPVKAIQLKLAETMNNCIVCHATFQLPEMKNKQVVNSAGVF